jgi:hypothetical protein
MVAMFSLVCEMHIRLLQVMSGEKKMMSAAILMTEGVEKVSVRPASSDLSFDKGEPDGISFRKEFQ